jgi:hypothetical protein
MISGALGETFFVPTFGQASLPRVSPSAAGGQPIQLDDLIAMVNVAIAGAMLSQHGHGHVGAGDEVS